MKIYIVKCVTSIEVGVEHDGYYYTSNKKDAKQKVKEYEPEAYKSLGIDNPIEESNIEMNKKAVLLFLNAYASHPDNG